MDDLEVRARTARDAGLTVLPIPMNYYADLQARFGLDESTVQHWQGLGILYDRNADGEFLHLYSETIGGLFVELVQRVGKYNDYGPGNAAVRLATQEQYKQQLYRFYRSRLGVGFCYFLNYHSTVLNPRSQITEEAVSLAYTGACVGDHCRP